MLTIQNHIREVWESATKTHRPLSGSTPPDCKQRTKACFIITTVVFRPASCFYKIICIVYIYYYFYLSKRAQSVLSQVFYLSAKYFCHLCRNDKIPRKVMVKEKTAAQRWSPRCYALHSARQQRTGLLCRSSDYRSQVKQTSRHQCPLLSQREGRGERRPRRCSLGRLLLRDRGPRR